MKGTIFKCMQEMVTSRFGLDEWKKILETAGLPHWRNFLNFEDVNDSEVIQIINAAHEVTGLSKQEVMDAFGEHWSMAYAPRVYKLYFEKAKNAREFLLQLDNIHSEMTRAMESARPPRFRYEWEGDRHLVMFYQSSRGLAALMPGLVRGVGNYYKERLTIKMTGNAVHIVFPVN